MVDKFKLYNEIYKDTGLFRDLKFKNLQFNEAQFHTFEAHTLNVTNLGAKEVETNTLNVTNTLVYPEFEVNGDVDVNSKLTTQDLVIEDSQTLDNLEINENSTISKCITDGITMNDQGDFMCENITLGNKTHNIVGVINLGVGAIIKGGDLVRVKRQGNSIKPSYYEEWKHNAFLQDFGKDNLFCEIVPDTPQNIFINIPSATTIINRNKMNLEDSFTIIFAVNGNATNCILNASNGVSIFRGGPNYRLETGTVTKIFGTVTDTGETKKIFLYPTS